MVMATGIYLNEDPMTAMGYSYRPENISPEKLKTTLIATVVVLGVVVTLVMGCIYFLLYGILLKKLKKNYRELRDMDI
jgi:uncharacterized protein with PQ loop repeat